MKLLDFDGTELTDLAKIVSSEVNEHIVLGKLLLILKKLLLECLVLFGCLAAGSCACKRECVKDAVLKLYERLGRCACDLNIRSREIEHVR